MKNKYEWYEKESGKKVSISTIRKEFKKIIENINICNIEQALKDFIDSNYERRYKNDANKNS